MINNSFKIKILYIIGLYFHTMSSKGYVGGQKNTFLSFSYTFLRFPLKGILMDKRILLSVFIKKCEFICSSMAPYKKHRFDTIVSSLFFMQKGRYFPICNLQENYFVFIAVFLVDLFFVKGVLFNDYPTIYTITIRVLLSRVEIPYGGKW